MASLRNTSRYMWLDGYKAVRIFWSILLLINVIHLILQFNWPHLVKDNSGNFFSANYGAIGIFILVSGLVTATVTFPLLLSLGSTRKNYVSATIVYGILSSAGMALVQSLVAHGGTALLKLWDIAPAGQLTPFLSLWYIQTVSYLLIFLLFVVLGMVFYRFGTLSGIITIAAYIAVMAWISSVSENVDFMEKNFSGLAHLQAAHYLLAFSVLAAGLLWLITRKAPVRTY